jgi:hypothetical protein
MQRTVAYLRLYFDDKYAGFIDECYNLAKERFGFNHLKPTLTVFPLPRGICLGLGRQSA